MSWVTQQLAKGFFLEQIGLTTDKTTHIKKFDDQLFHCLAGYLPDGLPVPTQSILDAFHDTEDAGHAFEGLLEDTASDTGVLNR